MDCWSCDLCGYTWLILDVTRPPRQCPKCRKTNWNLRGGESHESGITRPTIAKPGAAHPVKERRQAEKPPFKVDNLEKSIAEIKGYDVPPDPVDWGAMVRPKHDPKSCRMRPCFMCQAMGVKDKG